MLRYDLKYLNVMLIHTFQEWYEPLLGLLCTKIPHIYIMCVSVITNLYKEIMCMTVPF